MLSREDILSAYDAGRDAVVALVEQLLATQADLTQQTQRLTARVAELEARFNKDSHNSHQPPASDGPAKRRKKRSLRKRSGKKSGGQPGHAQRGVTRVLVDNPDVVVAHAPTICSGCGTGLETAGEVKRERRQVIEIPQPRPEVTEHQALHKTCPACQTVTAGAFPPGVTQPVQYGPRTKAVAVYLQTYPWLPLERTVEALRDLFGVEPSEGTLVTAQASAYTQLAPVAQATLAPNASAGVGAAWRQAAVAHVDETGLRVAGRTVWVAKRVMSTSRLTFYAQHAKRGQDAFKAIGLLIGFAGRRVAERDAWAPYLKLAGAYALCNAHLLRELIGLHEDTRQSWLSKMIRLLCRMQEAVADAQGAGQTELPAKQRAGFEAAFTRWVNEGLLANPPPKPTGKRGRPKQTPVRNLLDRRVKHRAAILVCLHDFRVPFDNRFARPNVTCACSHLPWRAVPGRLSRRSPAAFAARPAPTISAVFAVRPRASRLCANKVTRSSTDSPAFLPVSRSCRG